MRAAERAYLVVWEHEAIGNTNIRGRAYRGSTAVTAATDISAMNGSGFVWRDQFAPSVDSDGNVFLVAFAETDGSHDIYACTLTLADGALRAGDMHRGWSTSGADETFPEVASMHSGGAPSGLFMGVWNSFPSFLAGDIRAGVYLSPGAGDVYCTSNANSTGLTANLSALGSISIAKDQLVLQASNLPTGVPGLFFFGTSQVNHPFGDGRRCAGGQVRRMPGFAVADSQGITSKNLLFDHPTYGSSIFSGAPGLNFQLWYRDPSGGPAGFNYSNGLRIEFQP